MLHRMLRIALLGASLLAFAPAANAWKENQRWMADFKALEDNCRSGDASACRFAGLMIGQHDVKTGNALLNKGCDGGNAEACLNLAMIFLHGLDVPRNRGLALDYARRSCALGNKDMCDEDQLLAKTPVSSTARRSASDSSKGRPTAVTPSIKSDESRRQSLKRMNDDFLCATNMIWMSEQSKLSDQQQLLEDKATNAATEGFRLGHSLGMTRDQIMQIAHSKKATAPGMDYCRDLGFFSVGG